MTRLSQHLTVDRRVLERIVELADPTQDDVVLEPGCGDGRLTELLAERGCKVLAVEVDSSLADEARRRLAGRSNVEVVAADVLSLRPNDVTMVVGNPPYHISRRLVEWIIAYPLPSRVVLTFQIEFARKLVAKPGSSEYLYFSLASQVLYNIEMHDIVPPTSFRPRPKVTSCIVRMQRNERKPLEPSQINLLKNIFNDRRHTLGKVLRKMGLSPPTGLAHKRVYCLNIEDALTLLHSISRHEKG